MSIRKKIILLLITFCIFVTGYFSVHKLNDDSDVIPVNFGGNVFYAEVVSSDEKLKKGLSQRREFCDSCAMLFKFQKMGEYSFWMKDMNFPLDIIWIKQGKVAHLEKNVQADFDGVLKPKVQADVVLEINAGQADNLKIKVGDIVDF